MTDGTSGRTTWSITYLVPTVWANLPGLSAYFVSKGFRFLKLRIH